MTYRTVGIIAEENMYVKFKAFVTKLSNLT